MCYTVYVHITPNNKYYVGITKQNVQNRWKNSLGYKSQRLFWRAIQKYGWDSQAMKSDIYEYAWQYMQGELTLDEAKTKCFYEDWHLAKRQLTWFKRDPQIKWFDITHYPDQEQLLEEVLAELRRQFGEV